MKKGIRKQLEIIGLTTLMLVVLAIYIKICELLGLIEFQIGVALYGLSPLDVWLIIVLVCFAPVFYFISYMLYKFRVLDL